MYFPYSDFVHVWTNTSPILVNRQPWNCCLSCMPTVKWKQNSYGTSINRLFKISLTFISILSIEIPSSHRTEYQDYWLPGTHADWIFVLITNFQKDIDINLFEYTSIFFCFKFFNRKLPLENTDIEGMKILKWFEIFGCEGVEWTELVYDIIHWLPSVSMEINFWV
jgi:hypothetical protein